MQALFSISTPRVLNAAFAFILGVITLSLSSTVFSASFPPELSPDDLNGSNGFIITNDSADNGILGTTVSWLGDINDDGFDDFAIGQVHAGSTPLTPSVPADMLRVYIVFGSSQRSPSPVTISESYGALLTAPNPLGLNDRRAMPREVGDVNGDGIADILVNVREVLTETTQYSYVVFGSRQFPTELSLLNLDGSNGFRINGDGPGESAGDINDDGFDDIIFSAGAVVFGSNQGFPMVLGLSDLNGSNGFIITGVESPFGIPSSVSGLTDINGDGVDDVAISQSRAAPNGITNAGTCYVLFGNNQGFPATIDLADLIGSVGFRINGFIPNSGVCSNISGENDFNADGIADIFMRAPSASPNSLASAYIVYGTNQGFPDVLDLATLNGSNGFTFDATYDDDSIVSSGSGNVFFIGDVNDDGIDDFALAGFDLGDDTFKAVFFVLFGSAAQPFFEIDVAQQLNDSDGFMVSSIDPTRSLGLGSGIGDIDGDGVNDILFRYSRSPSAFLEGSDAIFLVYGKTDSIGSGLASITNPTPDSTLSDSTITFSWEDVGAINTALSVRSPARVSTSNTSTWREPVRHPRGEAPRDYANARSTLP